MESNRRPAQVAQNRDDSHQSCAQLDAEYRREQMRWAAHESTWSWSRLAIFVALVAIWIIGFGRVAAVAGATAASIAMFVFAVRSHQRARETREKYDRLLVIAAESQQRAGGKVCCIRSWQRPSDAPEIDAALPAIFPAAQCWPLSDQERDDLDLFAKPVGVFGLLNRCSTAIGARRLRDLLDQPLLDARVIRERQAAVHWLEEHIREHHQIMAALAALRTEERRLNRLILALRDARPLALFAPIPILRGWSAFSTLITLGSIGALALGQTQFGWLVGLVIAINSALFFRMQAALRSALTPWSDTEWAVRGCRIASEAASAALPDAGVLSVLRSAADAGAEPGAFAALAKRVGWTEGGGIVHLALNIIAFFDLHVASSVAALVVPQREAMLRGIRALAELDTLACLACLAAEQPTRCYPMFTAQNTIKIAGGVHPLVPADRVIANDVELGGEQRLWIITGSNMAGKSTFLRMAGVNVVLAMIGAPACARQMTLAPLRLITDLRARDNLAESESYFLSEVRHLRRMISPPAGAEPIFGLIDEPFRGTNSQDQTAASIAVVKHLLASPHLFLLATHDRHLTTQADGVTARNAHFRENLGANGMVFDYTLHDGPATTRNALRVLEREGYPASLLDDAHAWLAKDESVPLR